MSKSAKADLDIRSLRNDEEIASVLSLVMTMPRHACGRELLWLRLLVAPPFFPQRALVAL